jgi:hypothetical protein
MRLIAAVAATLTLLLAPPASAAPAKKAAPAKAAPAAAPTAAPAAGGGLDLSKASVSAYLGGEFGDLDGFYLRADGSLPIMPLTPKVDLLGVVSLGFTHLGADIPYGDISWNMLRVTAAARAQMAVAPQIEVFADAGLGFYFGGWSSEADLPLYGTVEADDTTGGVTMRFAAGGLYQLNEQMKLAAELGLNPYFGDADTTNFFIGVGVEYKL